MPDVGVPDLFPPYRNMVAATTISAIAPRGRSVGAVY